MRRFRRFRAARFPDRNSSKDSITSSHHDALSNRRPPSPQASITGSSISSISGNVNNSIVISSFDDTTSTRRKSRKETQRKPEETIQEYDHSFAESSSNYSKASSSYFSKSNSKSKSSFSYSFGSTIENDSFIVMSANGLSSIDTSNNSFCSYDPFTRKRQGREKERGKSNVTSSRDTSSYQQSHRYANHMPKYRPRLTAPLENSDIHHESFEQKHKMSNLDRRNRGLNNISPQSSSTATTQPITPRENNDPLADADDKVGEEFPIGMLDTTPSFNIPLNPPSHRNNTGIHDSSHSSTILNTSSFSHETSSLCDSCTSASASFTSSVQLSKDSKLMHAALAEKEFWMNELRATVTQHGAESVETAQQLDNLGSALLRCQVSFFFKLCIL